MLPLLFVAGYIVFQRQVQARDMHDLVVQGLVEAKMALDLGQREEGRKAVQQTLERSRAIIGELVGPKATAEAAPQGEIDRRS